MGFYSIKDLENFTQIKAHTLRIWEQRYNLLNPERTDTNIRVYTENDLKKILNINLLYSNGLKISKIAKLEAEEIAKKASEILLAPTTDERQITDRYLQWIINFDEISILKELTALCKDNSLDNVFSTTLIPVLERIGQLWQVDCITISHEHFFSSLLRDFIVRKTDQLTPKKLKNAKGRVLLFLKEGEYHELALLFYNYYLRRKGYTTFYLGQSLPDDDLGICIDKVKPDLIFTSLIAKLDKEDFLAFFERMRSKVDLKTVFVGGFQLKVYEDIIPEGIRVIHDIENIQVD